MRIAWLLIVLGGSVALESVAQQTSDPFDDLTRSVEELVRGKVDDRLLQVLKESDRAAAQSLFNELNRRLQGSNVGELGSLKQSATRLLPLLQNSKETRPYAAWLQTHMDYLEVADQLWRGQQPPPTKPGMPPPKTPAPPTPEAQRSAWDKQMEQRPLPPGASSYVSKLKPIFSAGGVPPELVWLAEVESSFNPEARSPVGAAGLFQFMPATARSLGLLLSPVDERLNPEKSARAAAKYLRYLYGRFSDWRLVFAAYNAGETKVSTLLTQYKTRSYYTIAPRLPAETQLYVPKIEATLRKREGASFSTLRFPKPVS